MSKRILAVAAATFFVAGSAFAQDGGTMMKKPDAGKMDHAAHMAGDAVKPEITATDLKTKLDKGEKVIVVDARASLGTEIIKGAVHVPVSGLDAWAKDQDKAAWIVTYCTCPHDEAAINEVKKLREMGFQNAFSLAGGLSAAKTAGIATAAPAADQ